MADVQVECDCNNCEDNDDGVCIAIIIRINASGMCVSKDESQKLTLEEFNPDENNIRKRQKRNGKYDTIYSPKTRTNRKQPA